MPLKKAAIFLNGSFDKQAPNNLKLSPDTLLIACDGGLKHMLKLGLKTDIIIGDFDSATRIPAGVKRVKYPADKDQTDAELAVHYAIGLGCKEIILTNFSGDRLDHMLGNVLLLTKPEFATIKLKIIDGLQEIYVIRGKASIRGQVGDTISLMPISGKVLTGLSQGLQYNLGDYELSTTGNMGISNVLTRKQAKIEVKQGLLLVIHQRQDFKNIPG